MSIKKNLLSIVSIVAILSCTSICALAQEPADLSPAAPASSSIAPRYSNIAYATPLVSRSAVGALFGAQRSMSLSVTATAYRNGAKIDTFSASTYGTDLDFEESASLQKGDVVKFVFNAGGEKINTSVKVS